MKTNDGKGAFIKDKNKLIQYLRQKLPDYDVVIKEGHGVDNNGVRFELPIEETNDAVKYYICFGHGEYTVSTDYRNSFYFEKDVDGLINSIKLAYNQSRQESINKHNNIEEECEQFISDREKELTNLNDNKKNNKRNNKCNVF